METAIINSLKKEIEELSQQLSLVNKKLFNDSTFQKQFDELQKLKQEKEQKLLNIIFKQK